MSFYTDRIASFIADTKFEDLPERVIHQAKIMILDIIGCAMSGFSHERGRISKEVVKNFGGNTESTIIGDRKKTSCMLAAYANANMASSLDNEETFMNAWHFSSNTVFSALALAERNNTSGKELIKAVATGYEVAARLILSTGYMGKIIDGEVVRYQLFGNPMSMGSVAAACSLLGLCKEDVIDALGIGVHYTSVPSSHFWTMQEDLPLIKYWDNGWMALGGVMAALMAEKGYTSYHAGILDGEMGFWRMYGAESCDFNIMVNELGNTWWIMETSFKPWPSCRWTHHPLTALKKIIDENNIQPHEVDEIIVKGSFMWRQEFHDQDPKGPVNPQFSAAHAISMLMFDVVPGIDWYRPEIMQNHKFRELRKKIKIEIDRSIMSEEIRKQITQVPRVIKEIPTTVEVAARGQIFRETVKYAKGDPWDPEFRMSEEDIKDKFRLNASSLLPVSLEWKNTIEDLIEKCLILDKLININNLTKLLFL